MRWPCKIEGKQKSSIFTLINFVRKLGGNTSKTCKSSYSTLHIQNAVNNVTIVSRRILITFISHTPIKFCCCVCSLTRVFFFSFCNPSTFNTMYSIWFFWFLCHFLLHAYQYSLLCSFRFLVWLYIFYSSSLYI